MKRVLLALAFGLFVTTAAPVPAQAAPVLPQQQFAASCDAEITWFIMLRSWDACLEKDANGVPQFKDLSNIWLVLIVIIEDMIKIIGYMAVGFIIWGGIKYLKSQGEPAETTAARQIITNALLGLVIALIAVAIVQFIAGAIS